MRRNGERQFLGRDAAAIVAHANQARTAILDIDFDAPRTGVETVLDEFLHHRRGPLDDFTGGDLVDEFLRELTNVRHGWRTS